VLFSQSIFWEIGVLWVILAPKYVIGHPNYFLVMFVRSKYITKHNNLEIIYPVTELHTKTLKNNVFYKPEKFPPNSSVIFKIDFWEIDITLSHPYTEIRDWTFKLFFGGVCTIKIQHQIQLFGNYFSCHRVTHKNIKKQCSYQNWKKSLPISVLFSKLIFEK